MNDRPQCLFRLSGWPADVRCVFALGHGGTVHRWADDDATIQIEWIAGAYTAAGSRPERAADADLSNGRDLA